MYREQKSLPTNNSFSCPECKSTRFMSCEIEEVMNHMDIWHEDEGNGLVATDPEAKTDVQIRQLVRKELLDSYNEYSRTPNGMQTGATFDGYINWLRGTL